jgi:hypothetical protein
LPWEASLMVEGRDVAPMAGIPDRNTDLSAAFAEAAETTLSESE